MSSSETFANRLLAAILFCSVFTAKHGEYSVLPRYRALRSHEIASTCATSVQAYVIFVKTRFWSKDKSAEIFSTNGRQSPVSPSKEVRGKEKSSKEDLSRDEIHKSIAKPPLLKGGKWTTTRRGELRCCFKRDSSGFCYCWCPKKLIGRPKGFDEHRFFWLGKFVCLTFWWPQTPILGRWLRFECV